jgi:hypothetical protein
MFGVSKRSTLTFSLKLLSSYGRKRSEDVPGAVTSGARDDGRACVTVLGY